MFSQNYEFPPCQYINGRWKIAFFSQAQCFDISGWICYAEKTHGEFILPYISTTRSPQQMMGSLVKGYFAEQQV